MKEIFFLPKAVFWHFIVALNEKKKTNPKQTKNLIGKNAKQKNQSTN